MGTKTSFILLVLTYLTSIILNSIKHNGSSAHIAAPYVILIVLFGCYSLFSIIITTKIYASGAFNWVSSNPFMVKSALFIGTVCMLYAVFSACMIKADWTTYQNQSISDPKDFFAFTSYIWLPLLTIVPFAILIFKNTEGFSKSFAFVAPLMLQLLIGFSFYVYLHSSNIIAIFTPKMNHQDYNVTQTLEKIKYQQSIKEYLYYTLPMNDKRITDAAFAKLKATSDWQDQMYRCLEDCEDENFQTTIHHFLSVYVVDHSEELMVAFGKSLACYAKMISRFAENEYTSAQDLDLLHIENSLRAIEIQFVGQEKMLFDKLSLLGDALRKVQRQDYKEKVASLLTMIENFKKKYV